MPVLGFSSDFWIGFPLKRDWERIYQHSPCSNFPDQLWLLFERFESEKEKNFLASYAEQFIWQLHYREIDISKSFVLASYFFEKGIPDEDQTPFAENRRGRIPFFPNFKKKHVNIKNWFDYYSDNFYYKLFSAWDVIAHILNVYFVLELRRIDFPNAVLALKKTDSELYEKLNNILNSPTYKKAKDIRNNITHNYLPNSRGLVETTKFIENRVHTYISTIEYITSEEIIKNMSEILELFQETVKVITER